MESSEKPASNWQPTVSGLCYELAPEVPIGLFRMHPRRDRFAKRIRIDNLFYEKNKTSKGGSAARDYDRIDVFLVGNDRPQKLDAGARQVLASGICENGAGKAAGPFFVRVRTPDRRLRGVDTGSLPPPRDCERKALAP